MFRRRCSKVLGRGIGTDLGYGVETGIARKKKKYNNEIEKEEYTDKEEKREKRTNDTFAISAQFHIRRHKTL